MYIERRVPISLLDVWFPLFCLTVALLVAVGLLMDQPWLALAIFSFGLLVVIAAFKPVPPVACGLLLRFGHRVVERVLYHYYWLIDGQLVEVPQDQADNPDFDYSDPDLRCETVTEYQTKREGWTFILPLAERLVIISLNQWLVEINEWLKDENGQWEDEEQYLTRAESFITAEGVHVIPEIPFTWQVVNPGLAFEVGGGFVGGYSPDLAKEVRNLVMSASRQVMGNKKLEAILTRVTENRNGDLVPIGERVREDILLTPYWPQFGVKLLALRVEDIHPAKDAKDILKKLEDIKSQQLEFEQQKILADQNYRIKVRNAEAVAAETEKLASANRFRREQEAAGERAWYNEQVAGLVGKNPGETTEADAELWAQYDVGRIMAESLDENSTVILPPGDLANLGGQFFGLFEGMRRAKRPKSGGAGRS